MKDKTGIDFSEQPKAVQDAVWSAAVQHRKAKDFIVEAIVPIKEILKKMDPVSKDYSLRLINLIYDKRIEYVSERKELLPKTKMTLMEGRYPRERRLALAMLNK